MTVVKVCGLTRLEDARVACDAGADWIGFIVSGESPRRIVPEQAASIAAACPGATAVAVMVAPTPEEAVALAGRAGASRVQLHRVDPATWPRDFPLDVTFAIAVGPAGVDAARLPDPYHLVLLDTAHPERAGGSGVAFAWALAEPVARRRPVMVAGGLDDGNVAEALDTVRPFGVDASSRLERAPGIKDADKVRRFVAAVRSWDAQPARRA